VLLAAHDVGADARLLVLARRLDGTWPRSRLARALAAPSLAAPMMRLAVERAETRRDALRLAGWDMPRSWAPIVAVAALAIAGRMALLGLPNVAFTYVVVFAGGLLYGGRVGAAAGALAMAATDLLLSGLQPTGLANIPAMAMLGLAGGALRAIDWAAPGRSQAAASRILAGCIGFAATLAFSVVADATTWALVPEYRATPGALTALVAAGLLFNVVPAVVNAVLFAVAVPAVWRGRADAA
jgi:hypothetical protein